MELLETQDPERTRLLETSDRHKKAMEKELTDLTKKTDKMLRNALIIGGSLAVTFLVISALSTKRKKKKKKQAIAAAVKAGEPMDAIDTGEEDDSPSVLGQVSKQIINAASVVLLDMARQKLSEYLATRNKPDEHS
jgi:hypothetical protein